MNSFLSELDRLINEYRQVLPLVNGAKKKFEEKIRLEFNYNSNHIEGNTLTYGETKLLLIFDETNGNHSMREYEEMKAHDAAFNYIVQISQDATRPLTEKEIKNLNELILVRPFWKEAITESGKATRRKIKVGSYKEFPNSVRLSNGEIFEYPSPTDTPFLMSKLLDWYNAELGKMHPVILAAILHYRFVSIHPFDDGNGRVARLLLNYVLSKHNLPPVVIKSTDKANYLRALRQADAGNLEPFIQYIVNELKWSINLAMSSAKGESLDEEDDLDKKLQLLANKATANKTEEIQQLRNDTSVLWVWQNVMFPFCEITVPRVENVAKLFFKSTIEFTLDYSLKDQPLENWKIIDHHKEIWFEQNKSAQRLDMRIYFNHFKKAGIETFSIQINQPFVLLQPGSYKVQFQEGNKNVYLKWLYHQKPSKQEIKRISDAVVEDVTHQLEINLNRLDK